MRRTKQTAMTLAFVAFGAAALAGQAEQDAIKAGCLKSTNWTEQACTCIAGQAGQLKEPQQAFLAATLQKDKSGATAILMQMSQAEMMEAGMFMSTAGPACQG